MTKNITLRMDEALLQKLRHKAVDAHMSLSAWVVSTLEKTIEDEQRREAIRDRALARIEQGISLGGAPLSRDDLYVR